MKANVTATGHIFKKWYVLGEDDPLSTDENFTWHIPEQLPSGDTIMAYTEPADNYIRLRWGNTLARTNMTVYVDDVAIDDNVIANGYLVTRNPEHVVKIMYHAEQHAAHIPVSIRCGKELQQWHDILIAEPRLRTSDHTVPFDCPIELTEAPRHSSTPNDNYDLFKITAQTGVDEGAVDNWFTQLDIKIYDFGDWFDLQRIRNDQPQYMGIVYCNHDVTRGDVFSTFLYTANGKWNSLFRHTTVEVYMNGTKIHDERVPCWDGIDPVKYDDRGTCNIFFKTGFSILP
jgi:hypothetical protein